MLTLFPIFNNAIFIIEGNDQIDVEILNQLIRKVRDELANLESSDEAEQITKHFNNTLAHLKLRMELPDIDRESYKGLQLSGGEFANDEEKKAVDVH